MTSRILIADDTSTVLDYLDIVFSRQGFVVTKAGYGEQALTLAQDHPPDVILLDVMMPGLDGLEVTRRLRADPRTARIPILLYSAAVGDEVRAQAMAAGADEFLGKTVHHIELVTRVREWMAARSAPGGTGLPELVAVGLDLVALLEAEWVWLLGERDQGLVHLAMCSERGEQQALEFLQRIGPGPFPLGPDQLWGALVLQGKWLVSVPVEDVARLPGGDKLAEVTLQMGGRAVTAIPLSGAHGERGALVFSPPPTLGQSPRWAQAVAAAARFASAALSLWADLPPRPMLADRVGGGMRPPRGSA